MTERQLRSEAVERFTCPTCGAQALRPCRRLSTDWTGKRPLWKRASLHEDRLTLAYRAWIEASDG